MLTERKLLLDQFPTLDGPQVLKEMTDMPQVTPMPSGENDPRTYHGTCFST